MDIPHQRLRNQHLTGPKLKHHSAEFDISHRHGQVYAHVLVIDGRLAGTCRRTLKKSEVVIGTNAFAP